MAGEDDDGARDRLAAIGEIAAEIAHELRNALLVVSASAYVARQEIDRGEGAGARPHVVKVEKYARIAHAIVDDLLLLARGDALRAEPVLMAEVLVEARAEVAAGAADWHDAIEPHDLRVEGHRGLLARLLHALYENAIQASAPRAPTLTTSARAEGERLVIEVADDGPGVPAHVAHRIFDPLVTARPGGTGLGLALARRIAAAHGGAIALAPADPSRSGARFRIELPRQG